MKKLLFALSLAVTGFATYAQTNTFPSSGSVGIGTTSPGENFDVTGSGGAFSATAKANAIFEQDHVNYRGVTLGYDASGQIGIIGGNSPSTSAPSSLAFWTVNSSGWAENMRLTSSGYLGIGTTTPKANLHVFGTAIIGGGNIDQNIVSTSFLANSAAVLVGWNRTSGAGETDFIANQGGGTTGGFAFYNHDNSNNESQLMWVMGNGQVLIGNTQGKQGSYLLAVAGSAVATSFTVKSVANWPDYVFKKDYQLQPLSQLQAFIDQNHHLPEMPSEKEVVRNGINLGEMDKLLTKKVEELTLYLIEKDKTEQEQKEINKRQSIALESQQEEIDQLKQQVQLLIKASNKN